MEAACKKSTNFLDLIKSITYLERFTHTKPGSLVYKTVENTSFKRSDFYMYMALNQEDAAV